MNEQNIGILLVNKDEQKVLADLLNSAIVKAKESSKDFFYTPNLLGLQSTFGAEFEIEQFVKDWQNQKYSFPKIEIVSRNEINNANGAFAKQTGKIYLAREFLIANTNNPNAVTNVLLEEYGHYLDSQLNLIDTPGDEGAIFAAVVRGEEFSESELQQLKHEDDSAVVVLDGVEVAIEQNNDGTTTRINVADDGTQADSGERKYSSLPSISADGRYIAFASSASNLVSDDTNGLSDIFVRDRQTGTTERVSISSDGRQATGSSYANKTLNPSISADGRYVVFESDLKFVPEDRNGKEDIYLHDRQTDTTTRISLAYDGKEIAGGIWSTLYNSDPVISPNGRYIAFESNDALVPEDTVENGWGIYDLGGNSDIYLYDREDGSLEQVSITDRGTQADSNSRNATISFDGRYIAFESIAQNIVSEDNNEASDIFVRDRDTEEVKRVSITSDNRQATGGSYNPSISADGNYIAFESDAALVSEDTNNTTDIYVRNVQEGTTEIVSVDADNSIVDSNDNSSEPSISADGRYIVFKSEAKLVPRDTDNSSNIYVRDLELGTIQLVDLATDGSQASTNNYSGYRSDRPFINGDGRYIGFASNADNLVADDTNNVTDIFLRDRGEFFDQPDNEVEDDTDAINQVFDLGVLKLEVVDGEFQDNAQTKQKEASGTILIGRKDGIAKQLRVDGTVTYDENTVFIDGTVYSLIGDDNIKRSPLFKGELELDIATATTKFFKESETLSDEYQIAGLDVDFKGITLKKDNFGLGANINFQEALGFKFAEYFVVGEKNTDLIVSENNTIFNSNFNKINNVYEATEKTIVNLLGFLPINIDTSNFALDYKQENDSFIIQGKLSINSFYGDERSLVYGQQRSLDIVADLSGDNYILIENGERKLKGSIFIDNIDFLGLWGFDAKLTWDEVNNRVDGDARLTRAFGLIDPGGVTPIFINEQTGIGFRLGFTISPFELNRIGGSIIFPNLQIPNTPLYLQEAGLEFNNIAPSSTEDKEVTIDGLFTGGPQIGINGKTYEIFEADLKATVKLDNPFNLALKGSFESIDKNFIHGADIKFAVDKTGATLTGEAFMFFDAFKGNVDMSIDNEFNYNLLLGVEGIIPEEVPMFGNSNFKGQLQASFTNNNNYQDDYSLIWGEATINTFWKDIKFQKGAKFYPFKQGWDRFEILNNNPIVGSYYIAPDTDSFLMSADWDIKQTADVSIVVETPDGRILSEDEFFDNKIQVVEEFTDSNTKTVVVIDPEPGIWDILVEDETGLGDVRYTATGQFYAPEVEITSLEQNIDGSEITINYNAFDADSEAQIKLFYDDDDRDFNGLLIEDEIIESDGAGSFTWNTEGIAPGDYHVYAMVMDENSVPSFDYSEQSITISQQADISVTQVANFEPVGAGEELTYTVDVTNNGDISSKGIILDQTFSSSVIFKSSSIDPVKQEDNTISFDIGDLEAGESKQIEITVTAPDTLGDIDSQSTVTSNTFDPDIVNDTAILNTKVADESIPVESTDNLPTLDIDGNGLLESSDYTLIDLYASFGNNSGLFDVFLQSYSDVLLGEGAIRTSATEITDYLASSEDSLFDLDGNNLVETSDYSFLDLYSAFGANSQILDIFLQQYSDVLIGENATRTSATEIMNYLEKNIPSTAEEVT